MPLLDGELQGGLQQGFPFCVSLEREQAFSEENSRHHPIRLLRHAILVVSHGFGAASFRVKRPSQAESEKLILGLPDDERLKLFGAGGHEKNCTGRTREPGRHTSTTKTSTPVALSGPPRRSARATMS